MPITSTSNLPLRTLFVLVVSLILLFPNATESATEDVYESWTISFELPEPITSADASPYYPDGPNSNWYHHSVEVPEDMKVIGFKTTVHQAPSEIIHHLSLGKVSEPSVVCGHTETPNPYWFFNELYTISRSNIHESYTFSEPYMIPLEEGEPLVLEVMTHSLEKPYGPGGVYENVRVDVELFYANKEARFHPVEFVRLRLDDSPCSYPFKHQAFAVPADSRFFQRSSSEDVDSGERFIFPLDGTILGRSVNIWGAKDGEAMIVHLNQKPLESYRASNSNKPWIWSVYSKRHPISVKKGDEITLDAFYSNKSSQDVLDASGMFGFYFAPDTYE